MIEAAKYVIKKLKVKHLNKPHTVYFTPPKAPLHEKLKK